MSPRIIKRRLLPNRRGDRRDKCARPGHDEALRHRDVLLARGVPESAIIVETRSQSTYENVSMAMPLYSIGLESSEPFLLS